MREEVRAPPATRCSASLALCLVAGRTEAQCCETVRDRLWRHSKGVIVSGTEGEWAIAAAS